MQDLVKSLIKAGVVRGGDLIEMMGEAYGAEYQDQLVTALINEVRKQKQGDK